MAIENIVGRKHEIERLTERYNSSTSEFIALYGRRRVGKTFLVTELFKDKPVFFSLAGQKKAGLKLQLENFKNALQKVTNSRLSLSTPSSWKECFGELEKFIDQQNNGKKIVLFFDELPWLANKKSHFLSSLEYFWNTYAVNNPNVKLIVCGSAASWMINKIVNSKEGLHNRLTDTIRLLPFSLKETKDFLKSRQVELSNKDICDLYMVCGGVAHYLNQVKRGKSVAQNIQKLCFSKDGLLANEFDRLYDSLFDSSERYKKLVEALSSSRSGLKRTELVAKLKDISDGTLSRILDNLEEAGFIAVRHAFGYKNREKRYYLSDEYSYFYLRWIKGLSGAILNDPDSIYWLEQSQTQRYKVWAGYSFENLCLKHIKELKQALGISGIHSVATSWFSRAKDKGTQIDLLIDRADNVISLCELKYWSSGYLLSREEAKKISRKVNLFRQQTGSSKNIFVVLVTIDEVERNSHYQELVHENLVIDDLFAG